MHVVYFHRGAGVEAQSFVDAVAAAQFHAERLHLGEVALPPREVRDGEPAIWQLSSELRDQLHRAWARRSTWRRVRYLLLRVITFGLWR